MYGPKGLRVNAVAPGATLTNIEAAFASALAQQRIVSLTQAKIPALAAQVAASITFVLSRDSTNIDGLILSSNGRGQQCEYTMVSLAATTSTAWG